MALRQRTWTWIGAGLLLATVAVVALVWIQLARETTPDLRVEESIPSVGTEPPGEGGSATGGAEPTDGGTGGGTGGSTGSTAPTLPTEPVELANGLFISREHETRGTVRVLQLPDGQVIVRLEDFETSTGPQLVVWLSQNTATGDDVAFDDDYVNLGPLKGNVGSQNYEVPAEVNAAGYTSVVVWDDRFDVSYGAADLIPTS